MRDGSMLRCRHFGVGIVPALPASMGDGGMAHGYVTNRTMPADTLHRSLRRCPAIGRRTQLPRVRRTAQRGTWHKGPANTDPIRDGIPTCVAREDDHPVAIPCHQAEPAVVSTGWTHRCYQHVRPRIHRRHQPRLPLPYDTTMITLHTYLHQIHDTTDTGSRTGHRGAPVPLRIVITS